MEDLPGLTMTMAGKEYIIPGNVLVIQAQGTRFFAFMGMDFPSGGPSLSLGNVVIVRYVIWHSRILGNVVIVRYVVWKSR